MPTELPMAGPAWNLAQGPLRVSANQRFLVHADGTPFFWLGDTAWELFHRLTREEITTYLEKRRQQGFNVIQAVALAEFEGVTVPNAYGHLPLIDRDPTRPDVRPGAEADYWKHVDFAFSAAEQRGQYIALLPTWGDKIGPQGWGKGPEIFSVDSARQFGRWIGDRYKSRPNLIWVVGGDRPLVWEDGRDFRPLWRALAEGIRETDTGKHLMTFHPVGGQSSSLWMHEEPWLDFNLLQSGHSKVHDSNYDMITADYARMPPKPVIDGEPRYEDHPIGFNPSNGWFDDYDVRNAAYWAVFAGACGHTYGCHDIWQFLDTGRTPVSFARLNWQKALDLDGAWDMQHLRALMLSRPVLQRIPDPSLIADGQGTGEYHVQACRDSEGRWAMLYLPAGGKISVHLGRLRAARKVRFCWFNPRTAEISAGGERDITRETYRQDFLAPDRPGRGMDWVLVIDDATTSFPPPGLPYAGL